MNTSSEEKLMNQKFKNYELLKLIGQGGMAEVLLGRTEGPGGFEQKVAIKRLHQHVARSEENVKMFIHEAKLTAKLNHPNVVRIYDFGKEKETYYIAMEYVDGLTLTKLIRLCRRAKRKIPFPIAVYMVIQVLEGLQHVHTLRDDAGQPLNLIHRDLTPGNILVSREGEVKISDFGIAKSEMQEHYTQAGAVKGKFRYMPPEQFLGKPIDFRADLFTIGVLLFELTTMRHLFSCKDAQTALIEICHNPPRRPSRLLPDYPAELEVIFLRAVSQNPKQRFGSATEMAKELRKFLSSQNEFVDRSDAKAFIAEVLGAQEGDSGLSESELAKYDLPEPSSLSISGTGSLPLGFTSGTYPPMHPFPQTYAPPPNNQGDTFKFMLALGFLGFVLLSSAVMWWFLLSQT